jgi:hypothetical protein
MAPRIRLSKLLQAVVLSLLLLLPIAVNGQATVIAPVSDSTVDEEAVGNPPVITSDVYIEGVASGGIGVLGNFFFTPRQADVVSYTFNLTGPAPLSGTVTAATDGTASLPWTPSVTGEYTLAVSSTTSLTSSATTTYAIVVAAD